MRGRVDALFRACYNPFMSQIFRDTATPSGCHLQIVQGDITLETVDAIVNAANRHLNHGGGVAALISRVGGPDIQRESDRWVQAHGAVSHARPAYTSGGLLPCKFVIHAVGPVWGSGDEDNKLASAVKGSLRVAESLGLKSIALPAISTGIFGFPKSQAARVILTAILEYLSEVSHTNLEQVRLVLYDLASVNIFLAVFDALHSGEDQA